MIFFDLESAHACTKVHQPNMPKIYRLISRLQLAYVRWRVRRNRDGLVLRHNKLKLTDSVIVGDKFTCSAPIYPVWMMRVRP